MTERLISVGKRHTFRKLEDGERSWFTAFNFSQTSLLACVSESSTKPHESTRSWTFLRAAACEFVEEKELA